MFRRPFYHQNKLCFTRIYLSAASAIFLTILVAPTVKPDMPIREAAANLINFFILTLFCVLIEEALCVFICRHQPYCGQYWLRRRSGRTCRLKRLQPVWLKFSLFVSLSCLSAEKRPKLRFLRYCNWFIYNWIICVRPFQYYGRCRWQKPIFRTYWLKKRQQALLNFPF